MKEIFAALPGGKRKACRISVLAKTSATSLLAASLVILQCVLIRARISVVSWVQLGHSAVFELCVGTPE